jgi:nitronate monooxygenase
MSGSGVQDLLRRPVVLAPMAGGPSTVELVTTVVRAGALAFLAGGYKTPQTLLAEVEAVRAGTSGPFGVNLFVAGTPSADTGAVARYTESLRGDGEAVGADLAEPAWDDDRFWDKAAALLADPPALVSFTFGCPPDDMIAAFKRAGALVAVTVTTPAEAATATAAGADALCVQGHEAGAHRGTFTNDDEPGRDLGLLSLIGAVFGVSDLPQFAAGGIMSPRQVSAVLAAGAVAAQCGTAFLRSPESGAHPVHKAALADPRFTATALTRAFSGRPARGLVNRFMLEHAGAPAAYPEINNATRALRAAAAAKGDAQRMSLWAGQGYRAAADRPAADILDWLTSTRH